MTSTAYDMAAMSRRSMWLSATWHAKPRQSSNLQRPWPVITPCPGRLRPHMHTLMRGVRMYVHNGSSRAVHTSYANLHTPHKPPFAPTCPHQHRMHGQTHTLPPAHAVASMAGVAVPPPTHTVISSRRDAATGVLEPSQRLAWRPPNLTGPTVLHAPLAHVPISHANPSHTPYWASP